VNRHRRIERARRQREPGHVALDEAHRLGDTFGAQALQHGPRQIDADDASGVPRQRQGDAPGPHADFQHAAERRQAGGLGDHGRDGLVLARRKAARFVIEICGPIEPY